MSSASPTPPAAQSPDPRRPLWPWIVGGIGGLIVLGVIAVVVLAMTGGALVAAGNDGATPSTAASSAEAATSSTATAPGVVTPTGVPQGQAFIQYGDGAASDTVVDVYLDFLCPYCKDFAVANGEDLKAMAHQDDMTVRIHVRPMLDRASTPEGYSGRAANAALAVYEENPENYWAMERLLFENQPPEGAEGLSDARLIELAHQAGASDAVDSAITSQKFVPYLKTVVEPEARAKKYGTPVLEVNGTMHEADDIYTPGSLKAAVEQGS